MKIFTNFLKNSVILAGLAVFGLGNFYFRTFMTNFDERDHLAAGFLMSKGWILYKDIFSHHFPFPYYWVNFWNLLWVNQIPHRGIAMFRTTLNIYYLFCAVLVLSNLKKFSNRLLFVIFLISTVPLMPLFHGNILLSETFGFFPLIMIIWLLFSKLINELKNTPWLAISSALLCSFAFWSQPLLLPIFILPLFFVQPYKKIYIFSSAIAIIIPILGFYINGSLKYFWEMSINFNWIIYPRYYADISPVTHFSTNPVLLSQIIGALFLFFISFYLLITKKFKYLFLLLFSLGLTLIRFTKIIPGSLFNFGILPFMMLINLSFITIIYRANKYLKLPIIILFGVYLFLIFRAVKPIFYQSLDSNYNYHVFWSDRQEIGREINRLTNTNEPILIYPHDVDLYYFAQRTPPDKFLYWFPWINDVSQYRLAREQSIVHKFAGVIYTGDMQFKDQPNFYKAMWPNLTSGYTQATTEGKFSGIWKKTSL